MPITANPGPNPFPPGTPESDQYVELVRTGVRPDVAYNTVTMGINPLGAPLMPLMNTVNPNPGHFFNFNPNFNPAGSPSFMYTEDEDSESDDEENREEDLNNNGEDEERVTRDGPPEPVMPTRPNLNSVSSMRDFLQGANYFLAPDVTLVELRRTAEDVYRHLHNDMTRARRGERRPNIRTKEHQSAVKEGEIVTSPWPYSAEIEALAPNNEAFGDIAGAIPWACGVSRDGSINGDGSPLEVQTPILAGTAGMNLIKAVAKAMAECEVNPSCGLHLHIDGKAFIPTRRDVAQVKWQKVQALKDLWVIYLAFEDVILSFLPEKRRGNRYCQSIREKYSILDIVNAQGLPELETLWYKASRPEIASAKRHKYHDTRYATLNLHSLFANKHYEVRAHSGTLNPRKILEWANIHTKIAERAAQGRGMYHAAVETSPEGATSRSVTVGRLIDEPRLDRRTNAFFSLLGLSPASRKYWQDRQNLFSEAKDEEVCVA